MTIYWQPPRERRMELRAVPKSTLPWAVPEVTVPQFVAPSYLALTIPLGIAAVAVLVGALALGAWSDTIAREE